MAMKSEVLIVVTIDDILALLLPDTIGDFQ